MTIISLGSWCRPAWQIRRVTGDEAAMPYDWQITSFKALLSTLDPQHDATTALAPKDIVLNGFSSLTDVSSGWVYQHDLQLSRFCPENGGMVNHDQVHEIIETTKRKYSFLFDRFRDVCSRGDVTFLRWTRYGHPDPEWPEVFDGEDPKALYEALSRLSKNFRLVYVQSVDNHNGSFETNFVATPTEWGSSVVLAEDPRKFHPTEAWTGDNGAWSALVQSLRP